MTLYSALSWMQGSPRLRNLFHWIMDQTYVRIDATSNLIAMGKCTFTVCPPRLEAFDIVGAGPLDDGYLYVYVRRAKP